MDERQQDRRVQSRLRVVQWAAWIDLLLLSALLTASFSKQRDFVHVLGPLHGINFLLLVVIVATAALDGLWGWWFPLVVFFTGGAPGALIGEWIIKRRSKHHATGILQKAGASGAGTVDKPRQGESAEPDAARNSLDVRKDHV